MLRQLTSRRLLARNTGWNIIGEGAPLLIGVVAIPALLHGLGADRFGILMIVWLLIGYLSLFDLGIGRALTNLVAQKLGAGEEPALPPLIWTANILMLGLGTIGGLILAAISHWLAFSVLKIPDALKHEAIISLYILSGALPAVICSTGLRGVLEAYQRFDSANLVRIPMGILSFAGPLAVLPFSHSLIPIVTVLAVVRYAAALAYLVCCRVLLPVMKSALEWHPGLVKPLLSFGGWMTVSNLASPIMAGMDRFFLGAIVSMQAVTFYATPYEVVTKLLIVPVSMAGVLFPAFSATMALNPERGRRIYTKACALIALVMGLLCLGVIFLAKAALNLWLGNAFAQNTFVVLQILAFGVFSNSMAQPAFALVQGAGRADWTGKLHLIELPFYLLVFWLLTQKLGITGTALAYSLRNTVDTILLALFAHRLIHRHQAVENAQCAKS